MPECQVAAYRTAAADTNDIDAVVHLLEEPARRGEILPRSRGEVTETIRDFILAEKDGHTVGCVTLRDFGAGLFEVRSLVVAPGYRGQSVGTGLVQEAVAKAKARGADKVFALTYHPRLFERLDFVRVSKERFPQKVWLDCARCSKREHCDEIALLLNV